VGCGAGALKRAATDVVEGIHSSLAVSLPEKVEHHRRLDLEKGFRMWVLGFGVSLRRLSITADLMDLG